METQELYRGRLIDHIQLVVADLDASRRFYQAVFQVLGIPIGGMAEDYFWADELFVSTADSSGPGSIDWTSSSRIPSEGPGGGRRLSQNRAREWR